MDEPKPAVETVKPMSFIDRLTGVFASPGEVFENVRLSGPTSSNWVIPVIIMIIVAIAMSQFIISNPSLRDQMGAMIKKGMEESVQKGKMTQEQADQAYEQFANPASTMATIIRTGAIVVVIPIVVFVIALAYWMIGKFGFKATSPYMKVVEVVGLTLFIGVVESLVTTMMVIAMDSLTATPSLALAVSNFDMQNKLHMALAKVNVFTFWSLAITGIGLAKLFQRDFQKVLFAVVGLWVIWSVFSILTGFRLG
jgi:hypothetical protein